jgi:hypothetical protein
VDRHAGFAASIAVREQTLQDLVRVLHHANAIPHQLKQSFHGKSIKFFLDVPRLTCKASNGDRLAIDLTAWGDLTVSGQIRLVRCHARVLVPLNLALEGKSLSFGVEGLSAKLDDLRIDVLSGGPFPAAAQAELAASEFHRDVEFAIRQLLKTVPFAPPLGLGLLGPLASATNTDLKTRVLDGCVAIGLDVHVGAVATHGNPNGLSNTTAGNDIGVWANPAAAPVLMSGIKEDVEKELSADDATLDSLTTTVEEGHFHIVGKATKAGFGSASFSMNVVPHLIRPATHEEWDDEYGSHFVIHRDAREEFWFEKTNLNVDVDPAWWVSLVEGLTVGPATLVIEAHIDLVRNNVYGRAGKKPVRTQEFTFAGTTGPSIRLKYERFECHTEGIFTALTLRPLFPAPGVTGPSYLAIEEVPSARIEYKVQPPFDAHPDDPNLFYAWAARRTDTHALIATSSAKTMNLSGVPALLAAPGIRIECRLFRVLGAEITEIFNGSAVLRIADRLDRSHPYVFWRHAVITPLVRTELDGSQTRSGYNFEDRVSNLHRTDFPGRCRMVSRFSSKVLEVDDGSGRPHLEYLDALPFARTDLLAHRDEVCDYCFFGGPTKTTPLIP